MTTTIIALASIALLTVVITISSMGKSRKIEIPKEVNKPKLKPTPREEVKEVVIERQIERRQQMALNRMHEHLKRKRKGIHGAARKNVSNEKVYGQLQNAAKRVETRAKL